MTILNHLHHRTTYPAALAAVLALGTFGASSTFAASDTTEASATVIAPIAIAKTADLGFGEFAPGAGGTVTIDTAGTRTADGPILSTATATGSAAKFDVSGDADATYAITIDAPADLADGATIPNTMALSTHSAFTADTTTSGNVSSGTLTNGAQSIYVGGVLTVDAGQVAGTYTNSLTVTVEYN